MVMGWGAVGARSMTDDAEATVESPMQGTIVSVDVQKGDVVHTGQQLLVIESMKMEHVINADSSGAVVDIRCAPGDTVNPGEVLITLDHRSGGGQRPVEALSTARTGGEGEVRA